MSLSILYITGGFLIVLGILIFVIDAFQVSWKWGLAIFTGVGGVLFLIKHWSAGKRGFTLQMLAIPLLIAAFFMQPKAVEGAAKTKDAVRDPFANMMNKAREAVTKVQKSRTETNPASGAKPATFTSTVIMSVANTAAGDATASPTPVLSRDERLAANRQMFKKLATDFQTLSTQRKALPKNDLNAIHAFNQEADIYAKNLQAARDEQEALLALEKAK